MKLKGTVNALSDTGEGVEVTITNVRWPNAAEWREYSPEIRVRMTHPQAKAYKIGNKVTITVKP